MSATREPGAAQLGGAAAADAVLRLHERFDDLPLEALFKEDLLRRGVAFSDAALQWCARFKPKAYFIFSFDLVPLTAMPQAENLRAPEEIALVGGPHALRRTIVSVRVNPASPYRVDLAGELEGGTLQLRCGDDAVADVLVAPYPEFYRAELPNGKMMSEVAPTIEWGYLVYLTVFRQCQYFGGDEECQFCDINENFRQQVRAGRPYQTVKNVEDVLAALSILVEHEERESAEFGDGGARTRGTMPLLRSHAYTITGGSITSKLRGESEVDFYCKYANAIEAKFPGRWLGKMVVQAHEPDDARKFKDAGIRIYHPNYEVWDPQLFEKICPGKARTIGRDRWVQRILAAAGVFGPAYVIPNFVAGVEMAQPYGFTDADAALRSTAEGLDFFMSHGVAPRFTTWCPEPLSALGSTQGPAPLEYHAGLLRVWRDTHRKHRLPVPPGYGDPGPGKAVFSVSAFMDVLEPAS